MAQGKITTHDKEVLKQIFSQSLIDDESNDDAEIGNGCDLVKTIEEAEQVQRAKELEVQGVQAAEKGDVDSALDLFTQAVSVAPFWPSAYNNRAQALRLKGDTLGAMEDLNKAIELSEEKGSAACQAFTQRALLKKKEGDDDGAKEDFQKAADLGSGFAKQVLAAMNPYAALCNQMLGEVINKLKSGECQ